MVQSKGNIESKNFNEADIRYMRRALELAALGRGFVSPNPMVGCVIVHEGRIIGEGWHRKYGEGHAEVNAIHSVEDESLLSEATCYVTLEPCAHHGKTPPCADLLISKKVKRVVIAAFDSNPLVGGQGIERMKAAGIQVETGCLEQEALAQNVRFFTLIEKKRPYIILKWAETADGFVARGNFDSKWISNAYSRSMVHQWRAEEDAILVGRNTALYDNPTLNVRSWVGNDPLRILVDRKLQLVDDLNLHKGDIPTLVFNYSKSEQSNNLEFIAIEPSNFMEDLVLELGKRKVQSLIIEGGAATLNAFIEQGLWDEAKVFSSRGNFGEGIKAPQLKGQLISETDLMGDRLRVYQK
ncbi:bifunctional diaminohydroxyphosphoribosylaminopyrimidine deaminase/5-amino-6-(5-phosphoribosylamino)uracil reductase [Roseivirga spongicola]|uniref:Riboflavin biosynthesis protein RibD n=1 Tax=Roseivirga spongicola TaxID=333140 RepID=A0A150XF80_9BACT|nr:bifunctional diaminohydroxyphosphoribosylaminopyrimidine deaminase/5-amino-6-(5-phosphoribosylamino)uracil reductase RibD [Roseivirga spongicola]KYG77358.1 bifunctional diaminohydroxyphosphoribosylaminopyrimidine deaminase/5-amino-6-(5-phosphoribosylamino)uracil reductase [Roseivirga spongicola]